MEDPAASASGQSARKEGGRPKRSRKASLKRTATPKEKKPKNVRWPVGSNYTVQQGEDMLFVMSNVVSEDEDTLWQTESEKRKAAKDGIQASQTKKKPKRQFKMPGEKDMAGSVRPGCRPGFGQNLPEEVLIKIFQMVVVQDGAVPFLCRMSQVCRLWNIAASSPLLWRKATLGHCWIAPGKDQTPETKKMVMDTVNWLAHNRFSQLRDFSLCHWTKNVSSTLEAVSQSCPHLASIKLSYCSGLNASAFLSLGQHSRSLHSIDLQYSEFQVEGFRGYLEEFGSQIKQILFTHGVKYHRLLKAISIGYCPDLELLEVNTKLDSKNCELAVCIQALQRACPKLKTFRMLNVRPSMRSSGDTPVGFPLLEELCIATTSNSYMTDKDLMAVLFGSTKLRVLDIRGCSRITADGLAELPCPGAAALFNELRAPFLLAAHRKERMAMVTCLPCLFSMFVCPDGCTGTVISLCCQV
ncbi:F-box/LRR-repeat protein 6 isoform 2-T3 [Odontesthes bonariensis]|uniref:F-box/LRR-repeat protein 6 isoform X2 n=1 Tax=Odontesthes bonariensis TaxID=219752 RepID=UPI003F58797B